MPILSDEYYRFYVVPTALYKLTNVLFYQYFVPTVLFLASLEVALWLKKQDKAAESPVGATYYPKGAHCNKVRR